MNNKIYTIEEIQKIVSPIAAHHGAERVFLFGSYARGEATPDSDLDFRVDCGNATDYFTLGLMYCDLEDRFQKPLDLLTTGSLDRKFLDRIGKDEVLIYPSPKGGGAACRETRPTHICRPGFSTGCGRDCARPFYKNPLSNHILAK